MKMHPETDVRVHLGDCLPILRSMDDRSVDLAYLDPPFFTQTTQRLGPRDRSREFSFDDLWATQKEYATFLFERLRETHRLLSDRGTVYVHCGRNAVHLARALIDDIFGAENFRAEIIWHYRRWSNSRRGLLPAHQTIIYYSKSNDYTFNEILTEYSPATNVDQILQRRSRDAFNKSIYHRDDEGNVVPNGGKRGVPMGDVWDIPFLNPKASERTGYPTQKPLLLLERLIALATNAGDSVLDPFCGSGTALVAANSLGRRAIGVDISSDAVELTKKRLQGSARSDSRVVWLGREAFRNANASAAELLQGVDCVPVQRNAGIDAILRQDVGGRPITVRVQRPGESLIDAVDKLWKASTSKNAALMFLIAVSRGGSFEFASELPSGVVIIDAPTLAMQEHIDRQFEDAVRVSNPPAR